MTHRIALLLLMLALSACTERGLPVHELSGPAMGTTFSVKIVAPAPGVGETRLAESITGLIADIEQSMSTYLPDSELSRFNRYASTDWFGVSSDFCEVVAGAVEISRLTGGAFDITVGPLVNLWGFGPDGVIDAPPADGLIIQTLERTGYEKLQTDCELPALRKSRADLYVDLSAYAKGYAVDRVASLLDEAGVSNYLVEIGGELRLRGQNAERRNWAIAIETPMDGSRAIHSVIRLTDTAVASSGDYRNFFEYNGRRYAHAIDPRTGSPAMHELAAVTVVEKNAAVADAMATALLVMGPERGLQFAEKQHLAAHFLLRSESGIEARETSAFSEITGT